jgi:hypothetical protein
VPDDLSGVGDGIMNIIIGAVMSNWNHYVRRFRPDFEVKDPT